MTVYRYGDTAVHVTSSHLTLAVMGLELCGALTNNNNGFGSGPSDYGPLRQTKAPE